MAGEKSEALVPEYYGSSYIFNADFQAQAASNFRRKQMNAKNCETESWMMNNDKPERPWTT
jgi:hypothetical protein